MKFRVHIEVDVSKTIAETIQRNGFQACPDGSAMQIRVPNCPTIPRRKTKVIFIENPENELGSVIENSALELLKRLQQWDMLDASSDGQFWKNEIAKLVGT